MKNIVIRESALFVSFTEYHKGKQEKESKVIKQTSVYMGG
jgi:hypothetical protein